MTFLNGLLALGAAAFTIPLLIHLLHRGRTQTVDWGAMHLLVATKSSNSRRMQWQHLLLLLLRCLLPVLLALAMSRPLIPTWQSSGGQSAMSVALVLDDSTSMFAKASTNLKRNPSTRFAEACLAGSKVLRQLPSGSVATVFLAGSKPEQLKSQSPSELARQLDLMSSRTTPAGAMNIDASLQEAGKWLAESPYPRRQLIMVTDMQTNEWKRDIRIGSSEPAEWLAQQKIVPDVALLNVGREGTATTFDNVAIDSISLNTSLASVGKEMLVSIKIANLGDVECNSEFIVLLDNDFEIDRQAISIAPKSSNSIVARWNPNRTGDHVLRAQILRDDDLAADNRASFVMTVLEPVRVLLVDGDRRPEKMQSETDFLRLALSPFAMIQNNQRDSFVTTVIGPNELSDDSLKGNRVMCLCNVPNLTEAQQTAVRTFVEQGNGLLIFFGDKIEKDGYQSWPTLDSGGLRLATILPRVAAEPTVRLQTQRSSFAPIQDLSQASISVLEKVQFTFRTPVTIEAKCAEAPFDANVAARFNDEQPWILQANLGKGSCVWINTAFDDDDSNLPSRSVFVPLVQRLVAFAGKAKSTSGNIAVASTWSDTTAKPGKLRIAKPDTTFETVETDAEGRFELPNLRLLGSYVAREIGEADRKLEDAKENANTETKTNLYAAQVSQNGLKNKPDDSSESRLELLDAAASKAIADRWNASLSRSAEELLARSQSTWFGREIWSWIWTALVVCFLLEIALEQSLSPRLRSNRVLKQGFDSTFGVSGVQGGKAVS